MKYAITAIIALAIGCAAIQDHRLEKRTERCIALCSAIEGAQCWNSPTIVQGLNAAVNIAQCVDAC